MASPTLQTVHLDKLLDAAKNLKEAVVLITGGGSGFGRLTAKLAGNYGARVFLVDINAKAIAEAAKFVSPSGSHIGYATADVTKQDQVQAAFEQCAQVFGRAPDIVYANAGLIADDHFDVDDPSADAPDEWTDITFKVNLRGLLITAAAAQKGWQAYPAESAHPRRLVLTASCASLTPLASSAMYTASKHGTLAYWKSLNDELAAGTLSGFEVHSICPFFSDTPIIPATTREMLKGVSFVKVESVAETLIFLATDRTPTTAGGVAALLLDDGDPCLLRSKDYEPTGRPLERALSRRLGDPGIVCCV